MVSAVIELWTECCEDRDQGVTRFNCVLCEGGADPHLICLYATVASTVHSI